YYYCRENKILWIAALGEENSLAVSPTTLRQNFSAVIPHHSNNSIILPTCKNEYSKLFCYARGTARGSTAANSKSPAKSSGNGGVVPDASHLHTHVCTHIVTLCRALPVSECHT